MDQPIDNVTAPNDASRATWRVWLLLFGVALPIFCLGQAVTHMRTDEADSWLFAYYGDRILAGDALYADYWDNKPPGIFWLNAAGLWLAGGSYAGVIGLCVVASLGILVLVTRCAWRWFDPPTAAITAVLAAIYLWMPAYRGGSNRPELFVVLFDLAAIAAYARGVGRGGLASPLLAGALAGGSMAFKQTGVAALAAILVHFGWRLFQPGARRGALLQGLALVVGLGLTGGAVAGLLALTTDMHWAFDAIVLHVLRYADDHAGFSWPRWFGLREHLHFLALPLMLAGAGLALCLSGVARTDTTTRPDRAPAGLPLLLTAWLLVGSYLVFIGPSNAFHYVPTVFAPLLLLAAFAVSRGLPWPRMTGPQRVLYRWLGLLWIAYMVITPLENHADWFKIAYHARFEDPNPFATRRARAFIEAHTGPDDGVFIWDYAPRVYWETRRPCPSRFTSSLNFAQLGPKGQYIVDDIVARLTTQPPAVVLLPYRSAEKMARGEWDDDIRLSDLGKWLCAHYRPADDQDPGSLLVHRSPPR